MLTREGNTRSWYPTSTLLFGKKGGSSPKTLLGSRVPRNYRPRDSAFAQGGGSNSHPGTWKGAGLTGKSSGSSDGRGRCSLWREIPGSPDPLVVRSHSSQSCASEEKDWATQSGYMPNSEGWGELYQGLHLLLSPLWEITKGLHEACPLGR